MTHRRLVRHGVHLNVRDRELRAIVKTRQNTRCFLSNNWTISTYTDEDLKLVCYVLQDLIKTLR